MLFTLITQNFRASLDTPQLIIKDQSHRLLAQNITDGFSDDICNHSTCKPVYRSFPKY